ncbi:lysine histidine transporter 1-like [Vicia villosa]|uniref:lysine histidine transporter 1-like n=1 Tax=Vicia villosa TaxID=3911 RepID=UPI00273B27AD|nr:lysine histidine transporter 1-like [Vicia villosa]
MESPNSFNSSLPPHNQTIVEKSEREKKIEEWLPINADRSAKWWYSAFHNVTAMVGAGVLGLPYAMSQLGCNLNKDCKLKACKA